ncbi:SymE family type I addiction module toxin [Acerihabitans sp. TG2]|uniref:SymE family type I addiction module toxin n=1 Tax=Acerihabitans sp. TG2 TaxID=3096008 RepID=UPI002B235952|nr:SymE family type I addiction module toxin [Acerihabitans sp. TG2]MEA9393204.1 SymE family type I addiction module toxin [Acerihabitans sp. TG2]
MSLKGKWLTEAGFTDGMLLKIRIMPGSPRRTPASCGTVWKDSALNPLTRTPPPTGSTITPVACGSPSNHSHP